MSWVHVKNENVWKNEKLNCNWTEFKHIRNFAAGETVSGSAKKNNRSKNGVANDKDFRLSVLTTSFVSPKFWYMRQLGNILGNLGGITTMWWGAAGGDIITSYRRDHNLSNKINRVLLGRNDSTLGIWDKRRGNPLPWDAGESEELVCFLLSLEQIGRSYHGSKRGGVADGSISVPSKYSTKGVGGTEYWISSSYRKRESLLRPITIDIHDSVRDTGRQQANRLPLDKFLKEPFNGLYFVYKIRNL